MISRIEFQIEEEQSSPKIANYIGIVPESGILFLRKNFPNISKNIERLVVSANFQLNTKESKQLATIYLEIGKDILSNENIFSRFNPTNKINHLSVYLLALLLLLLIILIVLIGRALLIRKTFSNNAKNAFSKQVYSITGNNKKISNLAPMAPIDRLSPKFDRLRLPPPPPLINKNDEILNNTFGKVCF